MIQVFRVAAWLLSGVVCGVVAQQDDGARVHSANLTAALLSAAAASPPSFSSLFAPISTAAVPSNVFPSNNAQQMMMPPRFLAPGLQGSRAIPTNTWWGNMIASTNDSQVQPVWASPYTIRPALITAPFGLDVSYPYPTRVIGGTSGNGNASKYYLHSIQRDFTFSAREFAQAPLFNVMDWDDLSVTAKLSGGGAAGRIETTLASGMAYVTAKYSALTPLFSIGSTTISTVNGEAVSGPFTKAFSSTRFLITMNNGYKGVLYASPQLTLSVQNNASELAATQAFTGVARFAMVVSEAQLKALDSAKDCLIDGASVQASDADAYSFAWKTSGDCSNGMLHFLQTHHTDTLDASTGVVIADAEMHSTTRGTMFAVQTKTTPPIMTFRDTTNIPIDFYPPRPISSADAKAQNLHDVLGKDLDGNWSLDINGSYYFNGKLAQKYAELCLLADLDVISGSDRTEWRRKCLDKLELLLQPLAVNLWEFPLHYDTVYRGIVSSQGLTKHDANLDFGNTMYNDHHYHYGYWIMTAAIVNYLDPAWPSMSSLNQVITQLIRDVANPSNDDPHFPKYRQFDWFRGHSYSHGISPLADGKDEESSSEEINFHYAVMLFGKATGNTRLQTTAKLLLKINARAIQTYFLMTSGSKIHPPSIIPNKVMGILFDNKADYASWFSADPLQVHGIQMIPITPITEYVRTKTFVQEEWDTVLSKQPAVVQQQDTNPWLSLTYANYATVDKSLALKKLQVVAMDDGLTRSWALFMAATRP